MQGRNKLVLSAASMIEFVNTNLKQLINEKNSVKVTGIAFDGQEFSISLDSKEEEEED